MRTCTCPTHGEGVDDDWEEEREEVVVDGGEEDEKEGGAPASISRRLFPAPEGPSTSTAPTAPSLPAARANRRFSSASRASAAFPTSEGALPLSRVMPIPLARGPQRPRLDAERELGAQGQGICPPCQPDVAQGMGDTE